MISDFQCEGGFRGPHAQLLESFIKELQNEYGTRVEKYAQASREEFEPCFCYGEQQTKTQITVALDAACGSYLLQEYPVSRERLSYNPSQPVYGTVDYFCTYGRDTKIKLLIEVKQGDIRYFPGRHLAPLISYPVGASNRRLSGPTKDERWTIYKRNADLHTEAVEQIKSIMNSPHFKYYKAQKVYGLALTLLRVFCRYENESTPQAPVKIPKHQWLESRVKHKTKQERTLMGLSLSQLIWTDC